MRTIKGVSYKFEYDGDCFSIIPFDKDMDFDGRMTDTLCFVEDLDMLFVAINKAIEERERGQA